MVIPAENGIERSFCSSICGKSWGETLNNTLCCEASWPKFGTCFVLRPLSPQSTKVLHRSSWPRSLDEMDRSANDEWFVHITTWDPISAMKKTKNTAAKRRRVVSFFTNVRTGLRIQYRKYRCFPGDAQRYYDGSLQMVLKSG